MQGTRTQLLRLRMGNPDKFQGPKDGMASPATPTPYSLMSEGSYGYPPRKATAFQKAEGKKQLPPTSPPHRTPPSTFRTQRAPPAPLGPLRSCTTLR